MKLQFTVTVDLRMGGVGSVEHIKWIIREAFRSFIQYGSIHVQHDDWMINHDKKCEIIEQEAELRGEQVF